MVPALLRAAVASALCAHLSVAPASAQRTIPAIVVTPYYLPTALGKVGSAVTVITRDQIEQLPATNVAGLLRTVPGVTVIESGGPGATTEVRLRGAETGGTLVLIDGVRVNDPATARDEFDFSLITLGDVERIEVLRGPQSAVYGSDALGGVVNIITRRPRAGTNFQATGEIGSYGTNVQRLSGGTASGDFRFLLSGEHVATRGFSRVGDRDHDEADGVDKWTGSFSGTYAPVGGPTFDVAIRGTRLNSDYDGAPPSLTTSCYQQKLDFAANAPNEVEKQLLSGHGRLGWASPDGVWNHSVTAFAVHEARDNTETSGSISGGGCTLNSTTVRDTAFRSSDAGVEYQGVADAGAFGTVLAGARIERERATYDDSSTGFNTFDSDRTFYAFFLQDQVTLAERLNLSFTGRYDGAFGGDGFLTGRTTLAYGIPATGTKLRASAGTAAKRPTAYMIGNNIYAADMYPGEPVVTNLQPERSFGVDAGIDQSLFDGRLLASVIGFYNRFSDLLTFQPIAGFDGYYRNIANAATAGVEASATLEIVPGALYATGAYTYLVARDLDDDVDLPRRPRHSGSAALTWTNGSGFEATISAVLVGPRYNRSGEVDLIPGYARIDLAASYQINPATTVFGRIENLTNATYQDPGGFNTPGLSAYAGLTWKQ